MEAVKTKWKLLVIIIPFIVIAVMYMYYQNPNQFKDALINQFMFKHKVVEYENQSYVIGWDFNEGQTCASRNLLSLIHWASTIKFSVVEPCVNGSYFNMDHCMNAPLSNNSLYFSDYFDVDYWNQQIAAHNFGHSLVPWKQFTSNLPQRAIIVYLWRKKGAKNTFVGDEIHRNAIDCYKHNAISKPDFIKNMLRKFNMQIVREICFQFDGLKPMDVWWFNKHILGNYTPPSLSVWFEWWPGSFKSAVYFTSRSLNHREAFDFIKPSRRVIEDSNKYQELFLDHNYVAIQLRTAKIARRLTKKSFSQTEIVRYFTEDCFHQLLSALEKVEGKRILALDLGRFGDGEASDYVSNDTVYKLVPKLVNIVYGNKWNWTEWEDSFIQATGGITDGGYIAAVQKTLVTNATCIITAGPGDFHNYLMKEYRAKAKYPCIHQICVV